ncbi:MAG: 3-isopropylmalate dehydratase small subunit [Dehalococcoidales bacterium]|nr:MAG: 3-isopropylmalate dehydratase small subunit [Dehalococcoidales bacterium]
MDLIKGKVWQFGDNINTDVIIPGRYMNTPLEEMKTHALEMVNPRFPLDVEKGDIIVGGKNFGCGSSREEAVTVLKANGVAAVICESFARIFFRNAISTGLPVIVCPGVSDSFKENDTLELDLEDATVTNINLQTVLSCESLSEELKEILSKGGILSILREFAREQSSR